MNLRPVIERELRVSARQIATYYSRVVPPLVLLVVGTMIYTEGMRFSSPSQVGSIMFGVFNSMLFALIWLVMPLSTADLISREKREDTLGLLLLTPLRSFEVVASKTLGGLLRGASLILCVLPLIAVPILLGGVTMMDLLRVALLDLSALVGAVGAGILTSSFSHRRGRAWFVSIIVAAVMSSVLYSLHVLMLILSRVTVARDYFFMDALHHSLWILPLSGWVVSLGIPDIWRTPGLFSTPMNVMIAGLTLGASLVMTCLAVWLGAVRVRKFSEEGQISARRKRFQELFTKERLFAGFLGRNRKRTLERNPSAWQVRRKWTARLAQWGWMFLSVSVLTLVVVESEIYFENIILACLWLGLAVLISVWLISATNLQHERDSGALELLLVTHLTPQQLVSGRLQGIRRTFLPATLLLIASFLYVGYVNETLHYNYYGSDWYDTIPYLVAVMFMTTLLWWMPVVGLCFSLNRRGVIASCLHTIFFAAVLPWLFPIGAFGLAMFSFGGFNGRFGEQFPFLTIWLSIVGVLCFLQGGLFLSIRRGKLVDFPPIFPHWFTRFKLGWLLPWVVPAGCWVGIEAYDKLLVNDLRYRWEEFWLFVGWQVTAWTILLFFHVRSRKALVEMLDKRTFLTE